jgi:hypothetical protein
MHIEIEDSVIFHCAWSNILLNGTSYTGAGPLQFMGIQVNTQIFWQICLYLNILWSAYNKI